MRRSRASVRLAPLASSAVVGRVTLLCTPAPSGLSAPRGQSHPSSSCAPRVPTAVWSKVLLWRIAPLAPRACTARRQAWTNRVAPVLPATFAAADRPTRPRSWLVVACVRLAPTARQAPARPSPATSVTIAPLPAWKLPRASASRATFACVARRRQSRRRTNTVGRAPQATSAPVEQATQRSARRERSRPCGSTRALPIANLAPWASIATAPPCTRRLATAAPDTIAASRASPGRRHRT